MQLNEQQKQRYMRNIKIKEIGEEGQKKLLSSSVLVIGAGGTGSPAALYLAAAGVGRIGIADGDNVELSNLQRQILHSTQHIGMAKTDSARLALGALNPDVAVDTYNMYVDKQNIGGLIKDYDIVIDASDNFETKFLVNDECIRLGKPFVHSGIIRFECQIMTVISGKAPCYRCVFGEPPAEDKALMPSENGTLGAAAGIAGSFQAAEAIKYLLGIGRLLVGRMLVIDTLTMNVRIVKLPAHPVCGLCKSLYE